MTTTHTHRIATAAASLLRVRWFVRAPIYLYRARLGCLLGSRFLMLEHIGRKSGARRYVVLEVVSHPTPDTYVVASGFAEKAQWFRNIVVNPQVRVYLGSRRPRRATARVLAVDERAATLKTYAATHPGAWRTLRPVFETTLDAQIEALPLVALDISSDGPGRSST